MSTNASWMPEAREPSSLGRRIGLGSIAFGGTALYVASFELAAGGSPLFEIARRIGVSAAGAWIIFGAILLAIGRRTTPGEWADVCLSTMAIGIAVMSAGALYNALSRLMFAAWDATSVLRGIHFAVLIAGDVAMGAWFVTRCQRKGMRPWVAISAWVFGLNAAFALLMAILP